MEHGLHNKRTLNRMRSIRGDVVLTRNTSGSIKLTVLTEGDVARAALTDSNGIARTESKIFNTLSQNWLPREGDFNIYTKIDYEFLEGSPEQNGFKKIDVITGLVFH